MPPPREELSVTAAGARGIARLVADAAHGSEVVVTRHGSPLAAVVGIEHLDELDRLRDDLRDTLLEEPQEGLPLHGDEVRQLEDLVQLGEGKAFAGREGSQRHS